MAMENDTYPFVQARWYTPANRTQIDLIVVHTMEGGEAPGTAEGCAHFFNTLPASHKASAHGCCDVNSIVESVRDKDIAFHAPGANHNGLGMEHAGTARQTLAQWQDPYSEAMLHISAAWAARKCIKYGIPIKYVDAAGLLRGERGFTKHNDVSIAFKKSTHWDPGPFFPMDHYLELVKFYAGQTTTVPAPPAPHRELKKGDHGEDVKFLQGITNLFIDAKIITGPRLEEDGDFGGETEKAVKKIEHFGNVMNKLAKNPARIKEDGIVDKTTSQVYAYFMDSATQAVNKAKCDRLKAAGKAVGK